MPPEQGAVAALRRWRESGADWWIVELTDQRAVIEMLTCLGEPVDRIESDDPVLIRYLRAIER